MDRSDWAFYASMYVLIVLSFFSLRMDTKERLEYFFFFDKPKSFKKKFKKSHNFLYKYFMCFVFNKEYIQESSYGRYVIKYYIQYAIMKIYGLVLLAIGSNIFVKVDYESNFSLFIYIYLALWLLNCIRHQTHCKAKGHPWWSSISWRRGEFKIEELELEKKRNKGKK